MRRAPVASTVAVATIAFRLAIVAVCGAALAPAPAAADSHRVGAPYELAFSPTRDWSMLAASVAVDLGLQLSLAQRNTGCRWCDFRRDATGQSVDTLNSLDQAGRGLRWHNTSRAARLSDLSQAALPALSGAALVWLGRRDGATRTQAWRDVVMMGEAVAVTRAVTQIVKVSARRHRPYVHAQGADASAAAADGTLSFFSGHASTSFSIAASAATIATLRGYKSAPWMWAGMAVAGTTGYLRMAADKHYATDVLTGAAIGTAAGVGLTYWLHGRRAPRGEVDQVALGMGADIGDVQRATIIAVSGAF